MASSFTQKVYKVTKKIPKGKVATYAEVAKALGLPGAARAVGNALNKNPYSPQVPCHRVVRSDGGLGGYASGPVNKTKLLKKEDVLISRGKIDLSKFGFRLA